MIHRHVFVALALIGWATAARAQNETALPPLPPAQSYAVPAPTPQQQAATPANSTFPTVPLGPDGVREVQNQLIALGFDPGAADGQPGPATHAAARRYNEDRGGNGPVPIDGALLARLQQDTGPRLTPEQVAARAQPRSPAPSSRYQGSGASNPLVGAMQQLESGLRSMFGGY